MAQTITLSALSVSPRYFTKGDTVTVTMSLKNNSSKYSIDVLQPELILSQNTGDLSSIKLIDWSYVHMELKAGKTGTYTATGICRDVVIMNYSTVTELVTMMDDGGIRCIGSDNMLFGLSAYFSNGDADGTIITYAALTTKLGGEIGILNRHLPGTLTRASLQRCRQSGTQYVADDEGEYIRSNIAFALGDGFDGSNVPTRSIIVTGDNGTSKTLTISDAQLNNMISSVGYEETGAGGLITGVYSNGENLTFQFVIGDAYETMTFTATVSRAFANVHMSGCKTGGVAFGKFSSSLEGIPLFECEYPALFGKGIQDFGGSVQCGVTASISTASGKYKDEEVVFETPYASAPFVIVGFQAGATAGNFGRCCCAVLTGSVTETGFTVRIYNGDSSTRAPLVTWIAIGQV